MGVLLYTYWMLFTPRGENINRISLITDYIDQSKKKFLNGFSCSGNWEPEVEHI